MQLRNLITEIWPFNSDNKPKEINYPAGEAELYKSSDQHMAVRSSIHNLPSLLEKVQDKIGKLDIDKGIEPAEGMPYLLLVNEINNFLKEK
tara:strand:- start:197 stop:469 length:273 start_codon:yes stop_codon:yes gene_type:complete